MGNLLVWIIVGGLAGWLAGNIMQGRGFGCIGNVVVGLVGAVIGGYVFDALKVHPFAGMLNTVVTAFVGAVIFLAVVNIFSRKR